MILERFTCKTDDYNWLNRVGQVFPDCEQKICKNMNTLRGKVDLQAISSYKHRSITRAWYPSTQLLSTNMLRCARRPVCRVWQLHGQVNLSNPSSAHQNLSLTCADSHQITVFLEFHKFSDISVGKNLLKTPMYMWCTPEILHCRREISLSSAMLCRLAWRIQFQSGFHKLSILVLQDKSTECCRTQQNYWHALRQMSQFFSWQAFCPKMSKFLKEVIHKNSTKHPLKAYLYVQGLILDVQLHLMSKLFAQTVAYPGSGYF